MGDRQGVRDHHSLTPTQDRGGNPLTGSLPFVSSCADPHQGGERIRMASAPDSDTWVIPTHAGKMGRYSPPALAVGSSPPGWGGAGCAL